MGYTAKFIEEMFVGLRFKGDNEDLVYLYVTEESAQDEFEEADIEFKKVIGDVLHLIEYQPINPDTKEITIVHVFIPVNEIRDLHVADPSRTTLARWNSP